MPRRPIVGIPCNRMEYQKAPSHLVKHQYIRPLLEIVDCIPVLIPSVGKDIDLKGVVDAVDGLLLTGSSSNVSPNLYGANCTFDKKDLDKDRDSTTFPLIKLAIKANMPLFAICRGFQEMNVVLGGTLHQHVEELPGKLDHRGDYTLDAVAQFERQVHKVRTQKGGIFEKLTMPKEFTVNSSHSQGVNKLGKGLFVEGISEDGLIEAFSIPKKKFILGMQWHPEGDFWLNAASKKMFEGFGKALRKK